MIADIDIWRAANLLVERHGEDAGTIAAMRADDMLEKGDLEGETVWLRILDAIEELLRNQPPKGVAIH